MVAEDRLPGSLSPACSPMAQHVRPIGITSFRTTLGWMALAWQGNELVGNVFGHASRRAAELALATIPGIAQAFWRFEVRSQGELMPAWGAGLIDSLELFAVGKEVDFSQVPLSLDHLTSFGKRVVTVCRAIPWGQTTTYGELAAECGSPGAARAVGTVMAKNRFPLIVPCHRVLGAGGDLGGYSAPGGIKMKDRLLALERFTLPIRPR